MKNAVAVLLCMLLTFSLAACAAKRGADTPSEPNESSAIESREASEPESEVEQVGSEPEEESVQEESSEPEEELKDLISKPGIATARFLMNYSVQYKTTLGTPEDLERWKEFTASGRVVKLNLEDSMNQDFEDGVISVEDANRAWNIICSMEPYVSDNIPDIPTGGGDYIFCYDDDDKIIARLLIYTQMMFVYYTEDNVCHEFACDNDEEKVYEVYGIFSAIIEEKRKEYLEKLEQAQQEEQE